VDASGQIAGAGASSQQAAQEAWIAAFQTSNPGVTISYDPVGSGGGREQFGAGAVAYAGTDVPLEGEEFAKGQERCGGADDLIEAPVYVSPIAVVYNVSGVPGLRLGAAAIASIFAGKVKNWNDPVIAATNPSVTLPDTPITPVHRSDKSGTTQNFTSYLSAAAGNVWSYKPASEWPLQGGEAAQGTSGVIAAVKAGNGAIGYADESQAGSLAKAEVQVGSEFVAPSASSAGKIFAASKEANDPGKYVHAYQLDYATTQPGTYPIVLVSYMLACTTYAKTGDAKIVQGFLDYVGSPAGQSTAAGAAGSAPIPDTVETQIREAAEAIETS
jgi:phosphate transport system substrate-binding protein